MPAPPGHRCERQAERLAEQETYRRDEPTHSEPAVRDRERGLELHVVLVFADAEAAAAEERDPGTNHRYHARDEQHGKHDIHLNDPLRARRGLG
jgi:hypothetical protein